MSIICAVSLAVGAIVAIVQMGVIAAPFLFCLPEHRMVPAGCWFFSWGLVLSSPGAVAGVRQGRSHEPVRGVSVRGASLTAYFAGVQASASMLQRRSGRVDRPGGHLCVYPMGGALLDLEPHREVFVATTTSGITAILLGVLSAVAVWLWLGWTDLFRRRCGRPWLDVSLVWDPAAREKYRWAGESLPRAPALASRGERFFLGTMARCRDGARPSASGAGSTCGCCPGAGGRLYLGFASLFGLGSVALAWYMRGEPFLIALVAVLAGEILGHSPLHSSMLVAGGRRERFWVTMASILILGVTLTLSVVLAFETVVLVVGWHAFAEPLRAGHPELFTDRQTPLNLRFIFLLLALFPISRLLEVRLCRSRGWMTFVQTALIFPLAWFYPVQASLVVGDPGGVCRSCLRPIVGVVYLWCLSDRLAERSWEEVRLCVFCLPISDIFISVAACGLFMRGWHSSCGPGDGFSA